MATPRLSLIFFCPMNSRRYRGRSFSSKDASSSACTAETRRSLSWTAFIFFSSGAATWAIVKRNLEKGQRASPALFGLAVLSRSGLARDAEAVQMLLEIQQKGIAVLGGYRHSFLHVLDCQLGFAFSFETIGQAVVDVG